MTFHDELLRAITGKDPIEDEWFFVRFREQFVNPMSTIDAFEAIGETVRVLLQQSNESIAIEVLEILIDLSRQSNTTEIPVQILNKRIAIMNQFTKFGDYANDRLKELLNFYRL